MLHIGSHPELRVLGRPSAGQQFSLDEVKEAVKETQKPLRGGKCFIKG
jgi:hypothetical protein